MTCNDCLYYEICPLGLAIKGSTGTCLKFKNKADFIEVIRCKNCKYGDVSVHSKTKDGQEEIACYCNLKKVVTNVDSYCSSGRKNRGD